MGWGGLFAPLPRPPLSPMLAQVRAERAANRLASKLSREALARMDLEIGTEMNLIRPKQSICLQEMTFSFPWKSPD